MLEYQRKPADCMVAHTGSRKLPKKPRKLSMKKTNGEYLWNQEKILSQLKRSKKLLWRLRRNKVWPTSWPV